MTILPRMRDWMFSSAVPGSVPANASSSTSRYAACVGSMGMIVSSIPSLSASSWASLMLPSDE